jgi:hypothetical protein
MVKPTKTILTKAHTKSDSLRTTVPMCIINMLELEQGDEIIWKPQDNKLIIEINHIKKEDDNCMEKN